MLPIGWGIDGYMELNPDWKGSLEAMAAAAWCMDDDAEEDTEGGGGGGTEPGAGPGVEGES